MGYSLSNFKTPDAALRWADDEYRKASRALFRARCKVRRHRPGSQRHTARLLQLEHAAERLDAVMTLRDIAVERINSGSRLTLVPGFVLFGGVLYREGRPST